MLKKALIVSACTLMLVSCDQMFKGTQVSDTDNRMDSLQSLIDQKDSELNDLMDAFNEIQDGFDQINEAEGRVNLLSQSAEGNNVIDNIQETMEFIENTMLENRRKIEELQQRLNASSVNSTKMQEALKKLTAQLEEKTREVETLRQQLEERDIKIEELGQSVEQLQAENTRVQAESQANAEIAQNQDAQLNTAYYVYGTSKELKEQKILSGGDVLKSNDFNAAYFTKIDIRKTNVIPLGSKSAKILTTHPEGSYSLLKDSKGEYTLRISDAAEFWSVSRYLVIKVK